MPTVVFGHGFGGNHEQESVIQEHLAQSGIAAYSIDFAGGTGYSSGRSEEDMEDMSVVTGQQDLTQAIERISQEDFVDTNNLFLMGASQGDVVATLTDLDQSDKVRGLILLYPVFSLFDDAHERFESYDDIPDSYNLMGLDVGRKYFEDVWNTDIFNEMADVRQNTLIVHGTSDSIVPYSYAKRASETIPNARLMTINNGEHGFSASEQGRISREIISFIDQNRR